MKTEMMKRELSQMDTQARVLTIEWFKDVEYELERNLREVQRYRKHAEAAVSRATKNSDDHEEMRNAVNWCVNYVRQIDFKLTKALNVVERITKVQTIKTMITAEDDNA